MLSSPIKSTITFLISFSLFLINSVIFLSAISFIGIWIYLLQKTKISGSLQKLAATFSNYWGYINHLIMTYICGVKFSISGEHNFSKDNWYLLISNHCSGADIPILYSVFCQKLPPFKFFLKKELIYLPLIGTACWALQMPFINRKKSHTFSFNFDLLKYAPCTIINFVEGSRVNKEKVKNNKSPYKYLLQPKFRGILSTLESLKEIDSIIDVTVIYQGMHQLGKPNILFKLFCGQLNVIDININKHALPECIHSDNKNERKQHFKVWLNNIWKEKDQWIDDKISSFLTQ
jgi:1-acyl-sn-glycerol-3-phosphate acyltransferase